MFPTKRLPRARQRGFTLVELIVSAALLGFLAVTATYFFVDNLTLVRNVDSDTAAMSDGRAVLERLAREIREVKVGAANCISTMGPAHMVFNKTAATGGVVPSCGGATPPNTTTNDIGVNIQLVGPNLNLGYTGPLAQPAVPSAVLTTYATAFALRYLDAAYAVTGNAALVRFVELSLTVQPAGLQATQARTVVALRNE